MVAEQSSLLSRGKSLSPTTRKLIKDAVYSCSSDIVGHFELIRIEFKNYVEPKLVFFSYNISDVSKYSGTELYKPDTNTAILFKGGHNEYHKGRNYTEIVLGFYRLVLVNTLCFVHFVSGFYCVPHCTIYSAAHVG